MRRVILESPFGAGKGLRGLIGRWRNKRYARKCLRDSLLRQESPIAPHLLLTQHGVLNDSVPTERRWGILAGHAWVEVADAVAIYIDKGISPGMRLGISRAETAGKPVEYRTLRERPEGFHGSPRMRINTPETPDYAA